MTTLVTGATGFVGSHVVRQLLAGNAPVRLLVRSKDKAQQVFGESCDKMELVVGDITDSAAVGHAINGCSAVIHTAAATPMKGTPTEQLFAVNVDGVRSVIDAALDSGIENIVSISSITAIFDRDGSKVTPDAPPKPSRLPYGKSKREAELYLRERQDAGAPISIVYPGGVLGPDDPGISDACRALQYRVLNGFRIFGDGGVQSIDVRDLAAFICSLALEGGSGRFLTPGVFCSWVEQADIIESVSGCRLERIPAQGWKLRLVGRLMDFARLFRTIDSPISAETMTYATLWPKIANSEELERRDIRLRSTRESFDDTLRWMVNQGHLPAEACPNYGASNA